MQDEILTRHDYMPVGLYSQEYFLPPERASSSCAFCLRDPPLGRNQNNTAMIKFKKKPKN